MVSSVKRFPKKKSGAAKCGPAIGFGQSTIFKRSENVVNL